MTPCSFGFDFHCRLQWRGRAKPKSHKNAHFGSDHVFADRHSSFNIFAFASLRRARYFSPQAQGFMQFSVALVCYFLLLLCTSAANNNGEARHGENAHFGPRGTFVDRHSGLSIFAFAALRRARYFSPQAQGFMQFSVALVCHFLLLLCTSAANNNGNANNAQNAHFGSDHTFVDRHSGLSIFAFAALRRARDLCNFLSRSFVTFRYFSAPARRTTIATRTTVKTHTSAHAALLSTGTAVSTFFCVLRLLRDAQKRIGIQIWRLKASKPYFLLTNFLLAEPGLRNQIFGHACWIVAKSCNFA